MKSLALLVIAVLLFALGFPSTIFLKGFFPGGWLMAIPLLLLLDGKHWRARILLGMVWGILAHGLLLWWLWPISWAGFCVFVLALAMQGGIFGALLVARRWPAALELFYIPSAWVISEYLRNQLLGGFTWGLGASQVMVPELIQPARWGGVYAVSWLILFFAAACVLRIRRKGAAAVKDLPLQMLFLLPLCCWIAGASALALEGSLAGAPLRVVLVQPNISRADKINPALFNDNMSRHLILSKNGARLARPDIIVWPETAFPDDILRDAYWRARMETLAGNFNAWFMFGAALLSEDKHDLNAVMLLDPRGQWQDVYYKRHLVPFSEYLPADPLSTMLARAGGMHSYHFLAGERRGLFRLDALKVTLGSVICSEEAYPALFRDLARQGAGVFVSVLNDGWFTRPEALMLHGGMAVLRAVETGRPVVRSANTGWSAGIDARGRVMKTTGLQIPGWVAVDIHPADGGTFYVKFGDVFAWLCAGFVIIMLVQGFIQSRGKVNMFCARIFLLWLAVVLPVADAHAAAAVQRRVQQQKQQQAQAAAQYQQQMMQQQQAQQVAQYQQAQQVAQYQQAQQMAQQAAAQKAAQEYAIQKAAMEAAVAKKQAEEQQAAQVVQAVAQNQAQQAAQYQQAAAYRNAAAMTEYKQAQELKAYKEAQTQAQLNGEIRQYAEYTAKRNALLQAQTAQAAQEATERQLLTHAAYQAAEVMKKRSELNAAYQEDVRRRLGQRAGQAAQASGAPADGQGDSAALDVPVTTVGLMELWDALDRSARPWAQIVDREIKLLTVSEFIDRFRKSGIRISHSPGEYVGKIDSVAANNADMLNSPFGNLLSYVAIVDYDFENGHNKDELARQVLGDANFWTNKRRVQGK